MLAESVEWPNLREKSCLKSYLSEPGKHLRLFVPFVKIWQPLHNYVGQK